jgi:hypothetical protein
MEQDKESSTPPNEYITEIVKIIASKFRKHLAPASSEEFRKLDKSQQELQVKEMLMEALPEALEYSLKNGLIDKFRYEELRKVFKIVHLRAATKAFITSRVQKERVGWDEGELTEEQRAVKAVKFVTDMLEWHIQYANKHDLNDVLRSDLPDAQLFFKEMLRLGTMGGTEEEAKAIVEELQSSNLIKLLGREVEGENYDFRKPEEAYRKAKSYLIFRCKSDVERAELMERFALAVREASALNPEDKRLEPIAKHAEDMAIKLRLAQPVASKESSNVPKIKWQWSERAFIRLFTTLSKQGAVPYLNEDEHITWEVFCNHFEAKGGMPFNPEQLSSVASKIKEFRISRGDEIARAVESAKVENESGAVLNDSPNLVAGSLSESGVSRSAPGRVGSERS